ncbi:MAG: ribosome maturation factor RimM [Acidimicrobiales bacterium]
MGRIARAHGLRGHVVVELVSNRPERMVPGSELWAGARRLVVVAAGPAPGSGRRSRWLVDFEGVEGRDAAEALRGVLLTAEPLEDPGALWVHELVGASVRDTAGGRLGRVVAVEANPASDLLVLDGGGLVPLRFVVSHAAGEVVVDPPAGLLEL